MDDVETEQQRDLQARLQGQRLDLARLRHAADIEHRADMAFADVLELVGLAVGLGAGEFFAGELVQLAGFFVQRHLAQQGVDTGGDVVGVRAGSGQQGTQ